MCSSCFDGETNSDDIHIITPDAVKNIQKIPQEDIQMFHIFYMASIFELSIPKYRMQEEEYKKRLPKNDVTKMKAEE